MRKPKRFLIFQGGIDKKKQAVYLGYPKIYELNKLTVVMRSYGKRSSLVIVEI